MRSHWITRSPGWLVSIFSVTPILLMLASSSACAGGAMVRVDAPDATTAALAPGADLIVQVSECGAAASLGLDAKAAGLVDGKKRTISLKLMPTEKTGVYGLSRQWPSTGDWVLSFHPKRPFALTTIVRVQTVTGATQLAGSSPRSSVRIASTRLVKPGMASREIESELKKGV